MGTFLVLRIVNSFLSLSQFALNIVIGLGLGLAIDYSLFIVSRYREELAEIAARGASGRKAAHRRSPAPRDADRRADDLLQRPHGRARARDSVRDPAAVHVLDGPRRRDTALMAVTVALIALPALLAVLGPRINALAPARWQRAAERTRARSQDGTVVQAVAVRDEAGGAVAIVSVVVLLALGLPATGIKFIGVDASGVPPGLSARTVDDALQARLPHRTPPRRSRRSSRRPRARGADRSRRSRRRLRAAARRAAGRRPAASLPRRLLDVRRAARAARPLDPRRSRSSRTIRAQRDPRVLATSQAATPRSSSIRSRPSRSLCRWWRSSSAGSPSIVLFLMTGSVVLPLKSMIMTFLSLSAAFGILVLIFQDGHLEGLLGFQSLHAIDISQPILIFAIAFGLSSDYAVFLLTRIKEAHDAGPPEQGVGRDRPRAHGPDRDAGGGPVLRRDRRLRDLLDRLHQGGRRSASRWRCSSTRRSSARCSCPR